MIGSALRAVRQAARERCPPGSTVYPRNRHSMRNCTRFPPIGWASRRPPSARPERDRRHMPVIFSACPVGLRRRRDSSKWLTTQASWATFRALAPGGGARSASRPRRPKVLHRSRRPAAKRRARRSPAPRPEAPGRPPRRARPAAGIRSPMRSASPRGWPARGSVRPPACCAASRAFSRRKMTLRPWLQGPRFR